MSAWRIGGYAGMLRARLNSVEFEKFADLGRQDRVTILLADDEPKLRQMLGLILQEAGYHLMIARDGRQALQLARGHAVRIDMLLSDIQMPGLTGPDLAKELLRARPNLKIMLMSGCVSALDAFESEWHFLQKPFAPNRLLEEVRLVLG